MRLHTNIRNTVLATLTCGALLYACGLRKSGHSDESVDHPVLPDTINVGTLYSPTSYFILRDIEMGYDYELITKFAQDKHIAINLTVASSLETLLALIDSGKIDVAAFDIPITAEYKGHVISTGPEKITTQVLVQPRVPKDGSQRVTDVTQLVGREIYTENNSKYFHRLVNLNDELGGGIKIHTIDRDTLITEDLIDMVAQGQIPLTVVDSDIAQLNHTYYPDLDISLPVSFQQRSAWGVRPDIAWMADTINAWFDNAGAKRTKDVLLKRYFELSKKGSVGINYSFRGGHISPYDALFRKYAGEIGMDWRLLATQGFAESQFDSSLVSWAGARGIMQIMPATARAFGLAADEIALPEPNIRTAAKIMSHIDRSLKKYVDNPDERIKFSLAAYNAGIGHIYDAIALAKKHGYNPTVWDGQVSEALKLKDRPEYYNDSVCRFGYFRGRETTAYVNKVITFYNNSKQHVKL